MKKSLKVFGTFAMLLSLAACQQNLGKEVTADEAARARANIEEKAPEQMPNAYTLTLKESMKVSGGGTNISSNVEMKLEYNIEKLYAHMYMKESGVGITSTKTMTEKSDQWVYYKDGKLFYVRYSESTDEAKPTKVYTETTIAEAQAKTQVLGRVLESEVFEADLEELEDSLSEMTGSYTAQYPGMKVEAKVGYYSTGDGNLSYKASAKGSYKETAINASVNYSLSFVATINDYLLASGSANASLTAKVGKESVKLSASMSISSKKGCSVSYPDLKDYTKDTTVQ